MTDAMNHLTSRLRELAGMLGDMDGRNDQLYLTNAADMLEAQTKWIVQHMSPPVVIMSDCGRCKDCKHYRKDFSWHECENEEVRGMVKQDYSGGATFEFAPDFGCVKWEEK